MLLLPDGEEWHENPTLPPLTLARGGRDPGARRLRHRDGKPDEARVHADESARESRPATQRRRASGARFLADRREPELPDARPAGVATPASGADLRLVFRAR